MRTGRYVFHQLTSSLSRYRFQQCVTAYRGDHYVKSFPCWQQFLCLAFGQLTFRESLRSIVLCLNAHPEKLHHLGFSAPTKRATLADANEQRDWRIYEAFGLALIAHARKLTWSDGTFLDALDGTFYAFDATVVDLCLSVFQWAHFRETKGAVKLHTLLDLRGKIPAFVHITDGSVHEVNTLDILPVEPGACYIMDRGYTDFRRLYSLHQQHASFILRAKKNLQFTRVYSHPVDRSIGFRCDQTIQFRDRASEEKYPEKLRRVKYHDAETGHTYVFLTNNFTLAALHIAELYKRRWDIEQFFRWIKGHLRIRVFWGTSPNAVKTQIWSAICTYLMVAIVKHHLHINRSMYEILQILSTTAFEKMSIETLFSDPMAKRFLSQSEFQAQLPGF